MRALGLRPGKGVFQRLLQVDFVPIQTSFAKIKKLSSLHRSLQHGFSRAPTRTHEHVRTPARTGTNVSHSTHSTNSAHSMHSTISTNSAHSMHSTHAQHAKYAHTVQTPQTPQTAYTHSMPSMHAQHTGHNFATIQGSARNGSKMCVDIEKKLCTIYALTCVSGSMVMLAMYVAMRLGMYLSMCCHSCMNGALGLHRQQGLRRQRHRAQQGADDIHCEPNDLRGSGARLPT